MSAAPGILSPERFERLDFDPDSFNHAAHVQVAWRYLQTTSLTDTIDRYTRTLRRLTERLGVPGKFHATMTWFLLILIAERIALQPDADWTTFCASNPDLFAGTRDLLLCHYSPERLDSEAARDAFLLPDRGTSVRAA